MSEVAGAPRPPRGTRWLVPLAALLVVTPLLVVLVTLRSPRWVPVLDLAQTEMRVRDVGTRHSPLVGLAGRIGTPEQQGSHPGPASFYALAPTYRAFGSSAWAMQVASVVVHLFAVGAALWIARRRGGPPLMAGVGLALAVLIVGYGVGPLSEPWNPYLPLLWWVVVLLGTWSAVCRDHRVLPVTVAAASFCAQTHIPYLGLCLGMGALAAAASVAHLLRGDAGARRDRLRWLAMAAGVGVVMWLPPTIDQVRHDPGNYSILVDHFGSPSEATLGPGIARHLVQQRLDLVHLFVQVPAHPGLLIHTQVGGPYPSEGRGAASLALWGAAVLGALALRHRRLLALHAVVGLGLVLAVLALSRVFGVVWFYLMIWVWGIAALMGVSIVWTAVALVARRLSAERRPAADRIGLVAVSLALVLVLVRGWTAAPSTEQSDIELSRILADLLPGTVQGLEQTDGVGTGHDGTYLVTWSDAVHIGSQGYGLVNELERRGYHVGVVPAVAVPATSHRVLLDDQATARVTLATGAWVERWRALPGATEVAFVDPRTPEQRARFEDLHDQARTELVAEGLDDLVARLDGHLFEVAIDPRVPFDTESKLSEMLDLGVPTAVFLGPVDVQPADTLP